MRQGESPTGRAAARDLACLSAWMHHEPENAAVPALGELRRLHNAAWISADDAIAEAYAVLGRFDVLDEFRGWSKVNEGRHGYWPHQD
ncbi:MAG TPA: hypothetical protein VGG88_09230, partial [Gaiellaceae bacterium]